MGFEQVFDNITVKHMDALRAASVSRRLCLELLFLDTWDGKQMLTMIVRNKSLWKSYMVCSDINEKYDIG